MLNDLAPIHFMRRALLNDDETTRANRGTVTRVTQRVRVRVPRGTVSYPGLQSMRRTESRAHGSADKSKHDMLDWAGARKAADNRARDFVFL